MEDWTIENAKYYQAEEGENTAIRCDVNGLSKWVPISEGNALYREIKSRVDAGDLTIADAD